MASPAKKRKLAHSPTSADEAGSTSTASSKDASTSTRTKSVSTGAEKYASPLRKRLCGLRIDNDPSTAPVIVQLRDWHLQHTDRRAGSLYQLPIHGTAGRIRLLGRQRKGEVEDDYLLHEVRMALTDDGKPVLLGEATLLRRSGQAVEQRQKARRTKVELQRKRMKAAGGRAGDAADPSYELLQTLVASCHACDHDERTWRQCFTRCRDSFLMDVHDALSTDKLDNSFLVVECVRNADYLRDAVNFFLSMAAQVDHLASSYLLSSLQRAIMHKATPIVAAMAKDAGLFTASLRAVDTPEPVPSPMPAPRLPCTSAKVYFGATGWAVGDYFKYASAIIERGSLCSSEERVKVGDFVSIDAPRGCGNEYIGRIIHFRAYRRDSGDIDEIAHIQWVYRVGATILDNGAGQYLRNELFMTALCDDQPLSSIRGKVAVRIAPLNEDPIDTLKYKGWIIRYSYDPLENGRLGPVDDVDPPSACPACRNQAMAQNERGYTDSAGLPHPPDAEPTDDPEALFRWRGREYHAFDLCAYGQPGVLAEGEEPAQLIQILSFSPRQRHCPAGITVRRFRRWDDINAIRPDIVHSSGARRLHERFERRLVAIDGDHWLPIRGEDGAELGNEVLILRPSTAGDQAHERNEAVAMSPLLVDDYYCTTRSPMHWLPELSDLRKRPDGGWRRAIEDAEGYSFQQKALGGTDSIKTCDRCRKARTEAINDRDDFIHSKRPVVVDLFAGFGGTALGIMQAFGVLPLTGDATDDVTLIAFDSDADAMATYKANLPFAQTIAADLDEVLDQLSGPSPPAWSADLDVDLLVLTPPCQAYSVANPNRSLADHRAALLAVGLSFIERLRPRCVLLEEVPGLLRRFTGIDDAAIAYRFVIRALAALGYNVDAGIRLVSDAGVTQSRDRILIVATRRDLPVQALLPPPTHQRLVSTKYETRPKIAVLGREDRYEPDEVRAVRLEELDHVLAKAPELPASLFDDIAPFDWFYEKSCTLNRSWKAPEPADASKLLHEYGDIGENPAFAPRKDPFYGELPIRGWSTVAYQIDRPTNAFQRYYRRHHLHRGVESDVLYDHATGNVTVSTLKQAYELEVDVQGPTYAHVVMPAGTVTCSGSKRHTRLVGGNQRRTKESIRELLRLQGFPDSFRFATADPSKSLSWSRRKGMVGNAVSPFMGFSIGIALQRALLDNALASGLDFRRRVFDLTGDDDEY